MPSSAAGWRQVGVTSDTGTALEQRLRAWKSLVCCLSAAVALALPPPAGAAPTPTPQEQQQLDQLFEVVFRKPSDRALNMRFVELAMKVGDYEAAIGTLDRLLFFQPNDPDFLLLIGEAYYRLMSYTAARGFYETVAGLDAATPEQRAAATSMLADIERRTRPSPWALYAQAGLRYQTNATSGPDSLSGIQPSTKPEEDFNSFVLGVLSYRQPVGKGAIEASLTTYYADQFKVDRLDLGVAELVAGPRLPIASGDKRSLSVKPYGIANGVLLGADPYLGAYGGGITARARLAEPLTLEPYFEYRNRNYFNSDDYPNVANQSGDLFTYGIGGNGALGETVSWYARGGLRDAHAQVAYEGYDEYFLDLSLRFRFMPESGGAGEPWLFTPSVSVKWDKYDAAHPSDSGVARDEFRWKAGGRLDVPVNKTVGLGVEVNYRRNNSNVARYSYHNLQVMAGPTVKF